MFCALGPYSQKVLRQILKIFVTLTWILEQIKHKKLGIIAHQAVMIFAIKNTISLKNSKILRPKITKLFRI